MRIVNAKDQVVFVGLSDDMRDKFSRLAQEMGLKVAFRRCHDEKEFFDYDAAQFYQTVGGLFRWKLHFVIHFNKEGEMVAKTPKLNLKMIKQLAHIKANFLPLNEPIRPRL